MGWERKRGKLLDLNQLLRGTFDAFPVKVGDLPVLPDVRYVITLDSDTQLPRDSAARLIGAIAHPLNRAVVNSGTRMVVEGYGILQPKIGISVQSATRSRLAAYTRDKPVSIFTPAPSRMYTRISSAKASSPARASMKWIHCARCWSAGFRTTRCSATI
jgi:cyclic beta-1,2-glucan synthetase